MVEEDRGSLLGLESGFHTILGLHVLEQQFSSLVPRSLRDFLSPPTVYIDSLRFDCVINLYRFLNLFDACKGGGSKW